MQMKRKQIEDLPDSLIGKVLGNLPPKDVCAARPACQSFRVARPQWSTLTLHKPQDRHMANAVETSVPSCLRTLWIREGIHNVPDVTAFPKLEKLHLEKCNVMQFVPCLLRLEHLVCLELYCCKMANEGVFHLKDLRLRSLTMSPCSFDDQGLGFIAQITTLETLKLGLSNFCTDAGIALLLALVNLTHLKLDYFHKLTDASANHIAQLPSLTWLKLLAAQFTDAGLAYFCAKPRITTLSLCICLRITDAGLVHLGKITTLTSLNLSHCEAVTDAGIRHLLTLSKLKRLNLAACAITDACCVDLAAFAELDTLRINQTKIADAGLVHVAALLNLRDLNLNFTTVTDAGLAHLVALTRLEKLGVYNCRNFTEAGLLPFASHPTLRQVFHHSATIDWNKEKRSFLEF